MREITGFMQSRPVRLITFFVTATLFFAVSPSSSWSAATAWQGRVVAVADGDTLTVEPVAGGDRVKVRLWGVDAPESKQPFGQTAKGYVSNATLFKAVTVVPVERDRYGRTVAVVTLSDESVLQERLLRAGLAWVYTQYCQNCGDWKRLERQAVKEKKGLWAGDGPVPPWKWRKQSR